MIPAETASCHDFVAFLEGEAPSAPLPIFQLSEIAFPRLLIWVCKLCEEQENTGESDRLIEVLCGFKEE